MDAPERRSCVWKPRLEDSGEGEQINGKLKMLPGGALSRRHADFKFDPQDFRFTIGKNSALYAFCMTVPEPGTQLTIKSLGKVANYLVSRQNS